MSYRSSEGSEHTTRGGALVPLAESVRTGRRKAVPIIEDALQRIGETNDALNAFVHIDTENALATAHDLDRRIEQGEDPGPLAGIPFGVKDLEDCAGMPTSHGSLFFKSGELKTQDSVHVSRLRAAGAIPVGKTATAEFGMDSATHTQAWGTTRNPWNLARTPGGSSGGSASAVAAGQVPLATASDAAGSTRSPAAVTGLVGMKPSHGRIPRESGGSTVSSLGALTKTVRDTARYLDAVAGPHDRDRMTLPPFDYSLEDVIETLDVSDLRVAWSDDLGYMVADPEVVAIARDAAHRLIDTCKLQTVDSEVRLPNVYRELVMLSTDSIAAMFETDGILTDGFDRLSDRVRHALTRFGTCGRQDLHKARVKMNALEAETAKLFEQIDVLLTPATTCAAFAAEGPIPTQINGQDATDMGAENYPMVANVGWNPSISVPAGLTVEGLPVGLLITGRRFRDDIVLRLARLMELAYPWPELPTPPFRNE